MPSVPRSLCWSNSQLCLRLFSELIKAKLHTGPTQLHLGNLGLLAIQGVGVIWAWGSRPPNMEMGKMSLADLLLELFLFMPAPVVKAAGKLEVTPTPLVCLTFCSATWNGLHPKYLLFNQTRHFLPVLQCSPQPPHPENLPWPPALSPTITSLCLLSPWSL